jgi:hypothetical protein
VDLDGGRANAAFTLDEQFYSVFFFGLGALIEVALHKRSFSIPTALRLHLFGGGIVLWLVANNNFHVNGIFL